MMAQEPAWTDDTAQAADIDEAIAALGTFEAQVQAVVDRALQRLAALRQACESFEGE